MALFRRKIMSAQSAVNSVSDEIGPVDCSNINEITYYVVGSTGVSDGSVQPETAHVTSYTGSWAPEGSACVPVANAVKSVAVSGVTHVRRVRISKAILGGTIDVWAIGR
jgi:hypothetical protein